MQLAHLVRLLLLLPHQHLALVHQQQAQHPGLDLLSVPQPIFLLHLQRWKRRLLKWEINFTMKYKMQYPIHLSSHTRLCLRAPWYKCPCLRSGASSWVLYGYAPEHFGLSISLICTFIWPIQITVPGMHSSLIPIVSGRVKCKKVCWYNPTKHTKPMQSVQMKNTLGTILDSGPVIVTEDGNYMGESMLDKVLLQGEEKIMPYSVNIECSVSTYHRSSFRNSKNSVSIWGTALEPRTADSPNTLATVG